MAKLEIGIGADISGFEKEISKVEKQLEKLKSQQAANIKLGVDTSGIDRQISDTTSKLSGLKTSLNNATTAFANNSRATANGTSTLTQFSRIAQDAPYGIIGVANNLTATAESFGYLAKSSGGAVNAFKAIGSSLLGPGGLILVFSAVTSGLTYMAQQGLSVGDVFNKLTGNFDGYSSAFKKASEEAQKSAIQETAALKGLVSIAQSEAQSKKIRLEAVDKLKQMYPNYFDNLSKEEIMYGNIAGVVDELSKALINKAIAEKLSEAAIEPTLKLWQANQRYKDAVVELRKAEQDLVNFRNKPNVSASQIAMFNAKIVGAANDKVKEAIDDIKLYGNQVDKIQKKIDMASNAGAKAILKPGASAKPQKQWSKRNVGEIPLPTAADVVGLDDNEYKIAKDRIGRDGQLIQSYGKAGEFVSANLKVNRQAISTETIEMLTLMQDFSDDAGALIENSIANTFSNLGNAIGEALATGGNVLKAAGNSILQSMGKFLSDMGDMLIKYGTLAVLKGKLDLAILTGGPVSIAAGVAAIGVGIALKAISGAIGAKANAGATAASSGGGSQRGAMSSGADVQSPTSSVNSGGGFSNNGGTVVFEISGQKLIGVLSNTLGANQRLGGNLAIGN